ncbi:hypothetical protein MMC12_001521 [Toensbergia leucococca]|nr:hypothetical protein [Toensbergia leucococca]
MATASADAQVTSPVLAPDKPTASPRKRRRRAPTTGAADDCFACQDRQVTCDRRRPYCTPCLDQGKDCSGYKTTLTWGVGVASRGKLRGLSLPIVQSKKVDQEPETRKSKKKGSSSTSSKPASSRNVPQSPRNNQAYQSSQDLNNPTNAATTTYGFVNMDSTSSIVSPMLPPPNFDWRIPAPQDRGGQLRNLQRPSPKRRERRHHSLEPLQVPTLHILEDTGGMPMSATVFGEYGEHLLGTSAQCSPAPSDFPAFNASLPSLKDFHCQQPMVHSPTVGSYLTGFETVAWPRDNSISSSLSSDRSSRDYVEDDAFFTDPVIENTLDSILSNHHAIDRYDYTAGGGKSETVPDNCDEFLSDEYPPEESTMDVIEDQTSLALTRSLPSLTIGATPGLQFLINYYDKVIAPVIVAFDGPTNPYRSHILRLAVESETLQHAIAALSASNLRMRRGQNAKESKCIRQNSIRSTHEDSVRKSSLAHSIMDGGLNTLPETSASEPSPEELHHKTASIQSLNIQLADPLLRKKDSILATLLMLCLYHICDTGVAQFKTQFAGVKKILALRGGDADSNSKETHWLTIMFTWFDAMTATVNDREGQLKGDVGITPFDGAEWVLENLAGCDGTLFQTIARLGRLNLLCQNKPVLENPPNAATKAKMQPLPTLGPKTADYYSMNYNRFDGNGWATLLEDDELRVEDGDPRAQFWKEWTEIRKQLQSWELDLSTTTTMSESLQANRRDLSHISESFRYSALLYTERLAYPHLPSSHLNFQRLVSKSLYHINHVKSDVFLLWPLFITGTECVGEQDRSLIRQRCLDIQKDSGFFNNISGLELLETMWRNDADEEMGRERGAAFNERSTVGGEGFKWRKVMERVDGEYIVV